VILRVVEYFRNDSVWGDEAMLVLNIATRPFHALLKPLDLAQVAPVPFLWAERLMVLGFGVNEWSLRAVPLLAGIGLCLAVGWVGRRILDSDEALVALVLVAFSQTLIRYSAEVKPYGLDALIGVVTVGAAAGVIRRMDNRQGWRVLAAVGTLAALLSLPWVFVCFGVSLALGYQAVIEKRANLLPRIGLLTFFWASLFAITYTQLYQPVASSAYLRSFWEAAFLVPGSPHLLSRTQVAMQDVLWGIDSGMALLGLGAITAALVVLGVMTLRHRKQAACAILLLTPGLAPFAASAMGMYPIATRLMLFASPLLIMLAAIGLLAAGRAVHRFVPVLPTRWLAAFILLPAIVTALAWAIVHERDQQMRPLVHELRERWRQGDAVYVFHRVVPAWLFYSTDWATPNIEQLAWAMRVSGPGGLGHENGPTRGPRPLGEGKDLVYDLNGHPVLLGTSSGVQGRPMFGYRPQQPDPGWAANEGKRIRDAASSRIWVIVGNAAHQGMDLGEILLDAVKQEGGRLTFQDSVQDGRLYRLELPPARE
jgi:hypothetical protein